MLDIGFVQRVILYFPPESRVENFLLDHRVDLQLRADLMSDFLLAVRSLRLFELLEQLLDLAMICFQQGNRVGKLSLGHLCPPHEQYCQEAAKVLPGSHITYSCPMSWPWGFAWPPARRYRSSISRISCSASLPPAIFKSSSTFASSRSSFSLEAGDPT